MTQKNFIKAYEESIKNNWEYPAFTDYQSDTYSYADVASLIYHIHGIFKSCEIRQGEKVALIGKNSKDWAVAYLATVTFGAVVVPILPDFTKESMSFITNHSDSVMLFVSDSIYDPATFKGNQSLKAIIQVENLKVLEDRTGQIPEKFASVSGLARIAKENVCFPNMENKELAVISYTSGTTGNSKGVMLSYASLMANIIFAQENMPLKAMDKIVSFLPLAHAYGCAFEFLFPVTLGCHITFLTKTPSPQLITKAFQEIRPRLILSVPLVIEKIYKKRIMPALDKPLIKMLRKIPVLNAIVYKKVHKQVYEVFGGNFHELVIGGAALNSEAELFFKKIKLPFTIGYGMTECGPLISYASWDTTKLGSAGRMVDTLELKIDSEDPYKIAGEILVRGINVMNGYYKNEEATNKVLDKDGWLHTGDLGITDKDNFVFIRGRSKNMILGPSGQNIYPEEIEEKFNNFPFVLECLVVDKDNKLIALLVPDQDAIKQANLEGADELMRIFQDYRNQVNKLFPAYMQVADLRIRNEEFEKTPKRSIKRFLYADPDKI
jgi:long-chain acyl-CoA synthetase